MGQMLTGLLKEDPEAEVAAGVDGYTGIANEYPVFASIDECDVPADVVIDFSNAKAADGLLDYCVRTKTPVVLCTTGLSEEQLAKVEEAAKETAVLKSANMSLGINLLMKLLKEAFSLTGIRCRTIPFPICGMPSPWFSRKIPCFPELSKKISAGEMNTPPMKKFRKPAALPAWMNSFTA